MNNTQRGAERQGGGALGRGLRLALAALSVAALAGLRAAPPAVAGPPAAPAAAFNVNSSLDQPDADPGNGACFSTPGGLCTLRAAIMEANSLPGGDTVVLQAGAVYTLTLPGGDDLSASGDLDLSSVITLSVAGGGHAIIHGGGTSLNERVLQVKPGAVARLSGLTLRNGRLIDQSGAGILNEGDLTLTDVTIMSNFIVSDTVPTFVLGAGLHNIGTLTLNRTTVSNNGSGRHGGGIYQSTGQLTALNSTISNNLAEESGGGLYVFSGNVELYNVTLAYNYADIDEDATGTGGGVFVNVLATVAIRNTLIGHNVRGLFNLFDDDCAGALTSGGYNLIANPFGCTVTGILTGNQTLVAPQIGPLADNGGATRTHALLANSPAVDGGWPTGCVSPLAGGLVVDQRGQTRPTDGDGDGSLVCDIGAFERQAWWVRLPLVVR